MPPSDRERRIERTLESQLARVQSPEAADEVVRRVERLAAGESEPDRAERTAATR